MVGSTFYLAKKTDFDWENAYDHFIEKEFDKIIARNNFDLTKKDALKQIIDEVDQYHACLEYDVVERFEDLLKEQN